MLFAADTRQRRYFRYFDTTLLLILPLLRYLRQLTLRLYADAADADMLRIYIFAAMLMPRYYAIYITPP